MIRKKGYVLNCSRETLTRLNTLIDCSWTISSSRIFLNSFIFLKLIPVSGSKCVLYSIVLPLIGHSASRPLSHPITQNCSGASLLYCPSTKTTGINTPEGVLSIKLHCWLHLCEARNNLCSYNQCLNLLRLMWSSYTVQTQQDWRAAPCLHLADQHIKPKNAQEISRGFFQVCGDDGYRKSFAKIAEATHDFQACGYLKSTS